MQRAARIIAGLCSMSAGMTAQFVTDALVMAIWRRGKPDALLHHSNRGSEGLAPIANGLRPICAPQ
jgi:transposase InsO family protein